MSASAIAGELGAIAGALRGLEAGGMAIAGAVGVDELAEAAGGAALAREVSSAGLGAELGVVAGVGAGDGAVDTSVADGELEGGVPQDHSGRRVIH